jgi:hypothetical protein
MIEYAYGKPLTYVKEERCACPASWTATPPTIEGLRSMDSNTPSAPAHNPHTKSTSPAHRLGRLFALLLVRYLRFQHLV